MNKKQLNYRFALSVLSLASVAFIETPVVQAENTCDYDESKNPLGPSICKTDSALCRGARICSQYGWCHGDPECPSAESCDITEAE